MKVHLFSALLATMFLTSTLWGQTVIVRSVTGQAQHAADCSQFSRRIAPGDRLPTTGCLRLSGDAHAILLFEGRIIIPQAGTDSRLSDLVSRALKSPEESFLANLGRFIMRSMADSESEASLKAVTAGVREKRAGIRGAASQEAPIHAGLNAEGEVGIEYVSFYWEDEQPSEEYIFRLVRQMDRQLMLEQKLAGNTFVPGKGKLALKPGESYTWQVRSAKDPKRQSERLTFTYTPDGARSVIDRVDAGTAGTAVDPLDRLISRAAALEEAGYKADAAALWEEALKDHAGDALVRGLAASFFARMDLPSRAASLRP